MAIGAYSSRTRVAVPLVAMAAWLLFGPARARAAQDQTAVVAEVPAERASTPTTIGGSEHGHLTEGDGRLQAGEARDLFTFEGRAGDPIVVTLSSDDFAPYLAIISPSGYVVRNTNRTGDPSTASIRVRLREHGQYQIVVTSFAPGERGAYELRISDERVKIAP